QNKEDLEKHIVNSGPINCADMIRQRAIKNPDGSCKKINTFIHKASPFTPDFFCDGDPSDHKLTCPHNFDLTICSRTGGKWPPKCTYAQSMVKNSQICIVCADNRPVHFSSEGPCDGWHGGTV
uniref:Ribonuclease A-domain domain-containing protein n=1 Tax=Leptobrachium leishanense TaxID=445787 RepID=A0A8C5WIB8_9ANUR